MSRGVLEKSIIVIVAMVLLVGLASCGKDEKGEVTKDILSQKQAESDRTQITVLVKYAFAINGFEKTVEEKFPNIDIVQVGNYTKNSSVAEYERRLEHDDLTDIIMTWPLEVGEKYWSERLIDLSGMDYASNYNLSMLNTISQDGALYYLPGPAQVRGIVYNKTLFEEKGWEVPNNYDEFISLCQTIESSGIRAVQLGFKNAEVLDTAFVGYNYSDYFSKPKDVQWIENYNKGEGSFGDHFEPALEVFQNMIDAGVWKQSDLDVDYSQREKMIFSRQCAMVEDSVLLARMGYSLTGSADEFGLMPFFNPGMDGDWARLYMVCYVGLNKHLEEDQNKEKYELVKQIMGYISTPEGQKALASDTGAMFSSVTDASPPNDKEVEELLPALNSGRYAVFPTLKYAQDALREGLAGMVNGTVTKEEVIKMVDDANKTPTKVAEPEKIGEADQDFTLIETGNFVTDAMQEFAKTDVALFLDNGKDGTYNGKGISASLYKGDVTKQDIVTILPDLKAGDEGVLWKVEMTGEDLIETLEYAIPVNHNQKGWYYYFSGLKMEYNPCEKPGERIVSVTTKAGKKIKKDRIYSIAVADNTVPEKFLKSCEKTKTTIESIVLNKVKESKKISPANDGRFVVIE